MMPAMFVETSALLRAMVNGERVVLDALASAGTLLTSELTVLEAERFLVRTRVLREMEDEVRARIGHDLRSALGSMVRVPMGAEVLSVARRPFPVEPVRSLDAVHLATLMLIAEDVPTPLKVLSTDRRVRDNARALGFEVLPQDPRQD